jgi:hypothetical protein
MLFPYSQFIHLKFDQDFDPKTPLFEPALVTSKKDKNSCPTLYIPIMYSLWIYSCCSENFYIYTELRKGINQLEYHAWIYLQ